MSKFERYSWGDLFENTNKIMRLMIALNLQADRVFEGRSKGIASERLCRKRLLAIIHETEQESLVKNVIRESHKWPWKLSEFSITQFQATSKVIPNSELDIAELINQTSDVKNILKKVHPNKEDLKKIADLGLLYFETVIKIMSWFERNVPGQLKQAEIAMRSNAVVPRSVILRFEQFQILSYILGYVGFRFVSYDYPTVKRTPKKWCLICFRRTALNGGKYCELHGTGNDQKKVFRFDEKVHSALIEYNSLILRDWGNFKKCIVEKEEEEREFDGSFNPQWTQWKNPLIKFINGHSSLAKRVSIEYIQSIDSWMEAVNYLRVVFNNEQEKSYHREAVWCWLHMARDWFEIVDMYFSLDGKLLKSSRSPISKLPTLKLIENLCKQESGIKRSEIARRLNLSTTTVGRCIKENEVLKKYFD